MRRKSDRSDPNAWDWEKFVIKQRTSKKVRYGQTNYFGPYWTITDINGTDIMKDHFMIA